MRLDKVRKVSNKLYEIATENEVSVFIGNREKLDEMSKPFEGLHLFITDGTPSQEKIIRESGKSVKYETSQTIHLSKRKIYDETLIGEKNEKLKVVVYENINELENIIFNTIDNNEITNSEKTNILIESINKLKDNILEKIHERK